MKNKFIPIALMIALSSPVSHAQTTINYLTLSGGDWEASTLKLVEMFEKEHPDIKVNVETLPFRSLFETIEVRMSTKDNSIDLLSVDVPLVASYASKGYLSPLDDYFPHAKEDFIAASYHASLYQNQLYSLPLNTSNQYLYYNLDLMEKQGLEKPMGLEPEGRYKPSDIRRIVDHRWTWGKLIKEAQKANIDDNGDGRNEQWGFSFDQVDRLYQLQPLGDALGSPLIAENGLDVKGYMDSPAWIKAGDFYRDLYYKYKVTPTNITADSAPELFIAGKIAYYVGGEWNVNRFNQAGVRFGVAPHPYFEGYPIYTSTGSWHIDVSRYSQNKDAAAKFIDFVTRNEQAVRFWFSTQGQLTAYKPLFDYIDKDTDFEAFPKATYRLGTYEALNTAHPRPSSIYYLVLEDNFASAFGDIRKGSAAKDVMPRAAKRIQRFIDAQ